MKSEHKPKEADCQKLLNISVAHIRQQGKPSVDQNGSCIYRNNNGLQCAAGPFINPNFNPGHTYNFKWQNFISIVPDPEKNIIYPEAISEEIFVLSVLQDAHDVVASLDEDFLTNYHLKLQILIKKWNDKHNMNLIIPS